MNSQPNNPEWIKSTCPPIAPHCTSTLSSPRIDADHLHQTACLGGGRHDGLLPPPIPSEENTVKKPILTHFKEQNFKKVDF